jgi:hypothetical protein
MASSCMRDSSFFRAGTEVQGRLWYCKIRLEASHGSEGPFRDLMRRVRAGDPQTAAELVRTDKWAVRLRLAGG